MKNLFTLFIALLIFTGVSAQNHCLHLDGENDYVNVSGFFLENDFTVSFWLKPSETPNGSFDDRVIASGPNSRFEVGVADSDCQDGQIWVYDQTTGVNCYDASLRDGDWHQVAITVEGVNRTIYLDGAEVGTFTGASNASYDNNFRLGQWTGGSTTDAYYSGLLDEVRIWDSARPQDSIMTYMNCELDGDEAGLLAYWNFNQGVPGEDNSTVTTLTDKTDNGIDGTLVNFALSGTNSNFLLSGAVPDGLCNPVLSNNEISEYINISPNPSAGLFYVDAPSVGRGELIIYNSTGAMVKTLAFDQQLEIDLSNEATGIYILQLVTKSGVGTHRLIKE